MAMASSTSFTKKARVKIGQIPGTKPSFYNNQLLISTGIPSLDAIIGGGLGVGTVALLEEDLYGNYARLMMKYFIAEAVMTRQSVFLSSIEAYQLIKALPAGIDNIKPKNKVVHKEAESSSEKMKIAWRYENKPKIDTSSLTPTPFGHYYDLRKTMGEDLVAQCDVTLSVNPIVTEEYPVTSPIPNMNPRYCHLLHEIREKIKAGGFGISEEGQKRNILRIGIHALGSPLWGEDGSAQNYDPSFALFMTALRALLRSSFAVAFITVPSHLMEDRTHFNRIASLSDTVFRLESFAGSEKEKNPIFRDYHGLFHVGHLPRLNAILPAKRDTVDLAFRLKRKKFTIETLHLPPELADSTGRSQDDDHPLFAKHKISSSGCGSTGSSKLDF